MQNNDTPFLSCETEHQFAEEELEQVISVEEYEKQLRAAEERGARKEKRSIYREIKLNIVCGVIGIFFLFCLYLALLAYINIWC